MKNLNPYLQNILFVLAGAAIIVVCGPLALNMQGYSPVSLQSLAVIMVPMVFGWKPGAISIFIYLLLGGFGLPVFADFKSGWDVFSGPTQGFLYGFLPAGILAGWWSEKLKPQYGRYFMVFLTAHVLLLLLGLLGFMWYGLSSEQILYNARYLFPGLFLKSFAGAFLVLAVKMKKEQDR
jgi:biotin transport system substrate-specific component